MPFLGVSDRQVTGSPDISPQGLVLAYDLRTITKRGTIRDFSGKGNDGRVIGTELVPGPFGTARAFRQASDYVALPFERSLHIRGPISLAVWARFTQLGAHQHILAYDDLYTLWIDENDRFRFSDTRGNAFESSPGAAPLGTWTSVVAVFAGRRGDPLTGRNIAFYVNGSPVAGRASGVWDPGVPIEGYVGKESHEGQFYLPFLGEIAAVLIFRRALSHREADAFANVPALGSDVGQALERDTGLAAMPSPVRPIPDVGWSQPQASLRTAEPLARLVPPGAVRLRDGTWTEGPPARARIHVPPRVVRITNIMPPYRIPTLEILQDSPQIRFEQWVMAAYERSRRWNPPSPRVRIFRDWGIDLSHRDMTTAHFNPGIIRELSRRPPDFVILGGYEQPTCLYAGLLLARTGVPFLLSSESIHLGDSLVGRQAPFLVQKLVQRCEGVIVPGTASRNHFVGLGVPEDRIFVAPNAVDVDRFAPAQSPAEKRKAREALGLPQDKCLCLYVGRLTRTKGLVDLLDAFAGLPPGRNPHLVVVGQGPLRGVLEARVAQEPALRGRVSFVGYVSEDLLPKYYMACDLFVFPTRRDIWGLVLNEAMCAGLPAISSDAAAASRDLIDEGVNGLVVPAGRPPLLRDALLRLSNDPDLRASMGVRARERILEGFTPRHQAMGFLDAIVTTLRRLGRIEEHGLEIEALS